MTDDDIDVRTALARLPRDSWGLRRSGVRRLIERGPAAVAELQQIRRQGPGRLRGAALEVLVNIVGEAGLHPADLAAAERLVRVKAPAEPLLSISACWIAWLCVRGGDQRGVMTALGLTPARPATFALASSVIDDQADGPGSLVFVTPRLNGWIVVAGAWCDPQPGERGEQVRVLVEQLSSRYGEAHAYSLTEYGDDSDWLIARHGRTVRRYSESVPAAAIGAPLPVERRHLDALGVTGSPEQLHGDEHSRDAFGEFGNACSAREVAAEMSIDIVGGVYRADAEVHGTGMLARTPGAAPSSIAPGDYEI